MGVISITIPLAYIYIPLIFFFSYYLLKFIVIKIVESYLKSKYYKVIEPEVYKIIYETFRYIEEQDSKGNEFDQREYLIDTINDRMLKILPKRVKFGGKLQNTWGTEIEDSYFGRNEIAARLVFPYWRTVVTYEIDDEIWINKEEILKEHRENSIDNILNE